MNFYKVDDKNTNSSITLAIGQQDDFSKYLKRHKIKYNGEDEYFSEYFIIFRNNKLDVIIWFESFKSFIDFIDFQNLLIYSTFQIMYTFNIQSNFEEFSDIYYYYLDAFYSIFEKSFNFNLGK